MWHSDRLNILRERQIDRDRKKRQCAKHNKTNLRDRSNKIKKGERDINKETCCLRRPERGRTKACTSDGASSIVSRDPSQSDRRSGRGGNCQTWLIWRHYNTGHTHRLMGNLPGTWHNLISTRILKVRLHFPLISKFSWSKSSHQQESACSRTSEWMILQRVQVAHTNLPRWPTESGLL